MAFAGGSFQKSEEINGKWKGNSLAQPNGGVYRTSVDGGHPCGAAEGKALRLDSDLLAQLASAIINYINHIYISLKTY